MARFVLVDQALLGLGGHFYEFDRNVLDAAAAAGLEPVLVTHRRCALTKCGGWEMIPLIRDGLWTHDHASAATRLLGRAASLARRARDLFPADSDRSSFRARLADGLRTLADRSLALVVENRDQGRITRLAEDLAGVVERLQLTADDHVFLPNVLAADTLAVQRLVHANAAARRPTWHLEYHVNLFPGGAAHDVERHAEARYVRSAIASLRDEPLARVLLYTDTTQLTEQHRALGAGEFQTLPIPVGDEFVPMNDNATANDARPLKIAFIGGGRLEKGFLKLEALIGKLWPDYLASRRAEFVIQANCPNTWGQRATWEVRRRLMELPSPQVSILPDVLGTDDYRRLVCESDVVLLPYFAHEYEARSSGIFAEALAAGVPTIVTAGTWMAAELDAAAEHDDRRSGIVCADDVNAFASAIGKLVEGYAAFRQSAVEHASTWRAEHSARSLVERLLARAANQHASVPTSVGTIRTHRAGRQPASR